MNSMRIAVVIAAYNEASIIGEVVQGIPRRIRACCDSAVPEDTVDIVVVDDGSRDKTGRMAREAGATVLRHLINRGQGAALKTGFDYVVEEGYDVVVSFDADGQHKAEEIELLVQTLHDKNLDVVLGSRFLGKSTINITPARKIILKGGVLFTRLISQVKVTDTHNGFRAFRASALESLTLVQDRMEHASEIIDQIGQRHLKFAEVPVTIEYTDYSKLKGQGNGAAFKIAAKMLVHKVIR